jgi:hypothetical protein
MSARYTDERGGSYERVIDLANGPGEPRVSITPLARGLSVVRSPRMPVRIGHVAGSVRDPRSVICTDCKVIRPRDARFIDAECPDCDSELAVLPNQEPGRLWYVIEHSPSCPALAAWKGSDRLAC